MEAYIHKVQYYETDKMGITHHSNYIRWMEEARVDYLEKIGWGYKRMEEEGIISPVLTVSGKFKKSTTFDDVVEITTKMKAFNGLRLTVEYEMKEQKTGEIVYIGSSEHCFLNKDFKAIRLKTEFPKFYDSILQAIEEE